MKNESGSTIETEDTDTPDDGDLSAEEMVSAIAQDVAPNLQQKHWRWAGAVCLLVALALAAIAVTTPILRDSMIAVALLFFDGTSDITPAYPLFAYIVYWGIFTLSILLAIYMVMLDVRYIRLDYAVTKRAIMKESWEHEDFRKATQAAHEKNRNSDK